jgi:hypothetical protein
MNEVTRRHLLGLSGAALAELPVTTQARNATGSIYARTSAEVRARVTPVNLLYPPGHVFRFCTASQISKIQGNVVPRKGCEQAIQNAIDSTTGDVFFPSGFYYIGAPLYISAAAVQNIRFVGESRTNTYIQPLKSNIQDASGINALIVNQQDNGKFSMTHIRLSSQVAPYSGVCISAVEGGPGDQQALFSGSFDDCWFDTGSTNGGFFVGGLNNFRVSNCTWEFQKGIFLLQGAGGGGDVIFTDCVLSNCFDYFIQHADEHLLNIISVKGLHAYTHNRGVLFDVANGASIIIEDVILQASSETANRGGIGVGSFRRCTHVQIRDVNVVANCATGMGPTATQLAFEDCAAQVSDCLSDGCDSGIVLAGTGANRLSFDHVDIVNAVTACLQVNTGNPAGSLTVSNSNWSDCQGSNIRFTVAASLDLYMEHCQIMNAGLGGKSVSRNIGSRTSGLLRMSNCVIGQNNNSAAAAYYIDAAGTGQFLLVNPTFVGIPPAGIQNPSATQQASVGETSVAYSASMTFSTALFERFVITATNGSAFTINAPTSGCYGKRISVIIRNGSGKALGAVTWAAVFKLARWTQPRSGHSRAIDFRFDGSNWVELARTPSDVPN